MDWLMLLATAVALLVFWSMRITDAAIVDDPAQNLLMSINLERTGVISLSESPPLIPSMQREPVPILVGALAVRAVDAVLGSAQKSEYFHGERARLLKFQNVAWLALLSITTFKIGRWLGLAPALSLLCVVLSNLLLLQFDYGSYLLNSLYTEAPAAALLSAGSLLLSMAISRRSLKLMALAGLSFGLLSLVKAGFLYVTIGLVVAAPCLALLARVPVRDAAKQAAVLAALAAIVILPWMCRDYLTLGYFAIALRGGDAVYNRAIMDQMTRDEYIGSIYMWAPYPLGGVFRRILGYSRSDKEEGGRLQRLNESSTSSFAARDKAAEEAGRTQDTVTYYRRARADAIRWTRQLIADGDPNPLKAADLEMRRRALAMILQHPWRHAALTLPLLWRGAYFNFVPLAAAFIYAVRRRRKELQLLVLPSLALVVFYALLATLESRYSMPTYPIVICLLVAFARHVVPRLREKTQ
ncbi:MAG TPA: hypothetical protein VIY90_14105 [Steroidobacteraceae bacterium]